MRPPHTQTHTHTHERTPTHSHHACAQKRYLFRLRGKDAKGKLAELGRRLIKQELREDHAGGNSVHAHVTRVLLLLIALHKSMLVSTLPSTVS